MKKLSLIYLGMAAAVICFYSCTKSSMSSVPSDQNFGSSTAKISADLNGRTRLTLQPGPDDGQDAYIYIYKFGAHAKDADNNYNSVPELPILNWGEARAKVFIRFDSLVKIPVNAQLESATLQLFGLDSFSIVHPQGDAVQGSGTNRALISKVKSPWDESTITWNNAPDAYNLKIDTIPPSDQQWLYNPKMDVTDLVRGWIKNPGTNYGFFISLDLPRPTRSLVFASSEASDPAKRPKLTVVYK